MNSVNRRSWLLGLSILFMPAVALLAEPPATAPATTAPATQPALAQLEADARLSDFFARRGDYDGAIKPLEAALKLAPTNKPLRIRLARLYMAANPPRWEQLDQLLHACEADDRLKSDPIWLYLESLGLADRGQLTAAIAMMRQARDMAPAEESIEEQYLNLLMRAKQYTDAIKEIDRVMGTSKHVWWLHEKRGEALAFHGQREEAKKEFQEALAAVDGAGRRDLAADIILAIADHIDPDTALTILQPRIGVDPGWRLLAIRLDGMKEDYASGLKLAEAVAADPLATADQHLTATRDVAEYATREKLFDKAKSAYESWLTQSPGNMIALNNLACLLNDDLKQPQEALKYAKAAYDQMQKRYSQADVLISDTYGWVSVCCGGEQAAMGRALLEQVVARDQRYIVARYHLAEGYLKAGDSKSAIKELHIAQAMIATTQPTRVKVSDEVKKNIQQALSQANYDAAKANSDVP